MMKNNDMNDMKTFIKIAICGLLLFSVSSCNKTDKFTESIFVDEPLAETNFDKWLNDNYLVPYNLDFRYKMQDVGSDISFNLVPTSLDKAGDLAVLVKYLWFDVYSEVAYADFLKLYGPRIIHLIGSPAYNPVLGTIVLGTAEGGIKVTLYRCNDFAANNIDIMNEYYFKTLHHEFMHILHQQKTYPKEFDNLSAGYYDPMGWQNRTLSEAASIGCVSQYGSSQPREDFVEIIANYIVKSDAWWQSILVLASKPGIDVSGQTVTNNLSMRGDEIIKAKLEICRKWLKDSWQINLDSLHTDVQRRQLDVDKILSEKYW
jgi:substrate import-associated zinc metallohydrolase lipoprotein